jgi:hypothetical protein
MSRGALLKKVGQLSISGALRDVAVTNGGADVTNSKS